MSDHLGGLTDAALVDLIRKTVASAGLCGFDCLDEARQLLAEAATRIEEVRLRLRAQCEITTAAYREIDHIEKGQSAERERLAALVSDMAGKTTIKSARPALLLASHLVRRGRELTEDEKLTNLVAGIADFDPELAAGIAKETGVPMPSDPA